MAEPWARYPSPSMSSSSSAAAHSLDQPTSMVHRPAPVVVIYVCMVVLGGMFVPGIVMAPERLLNANAVVGFVILFAFELGLFAIAQRHVVLSVDATRSTLTLTAKGWPLSPRTRHVALADVRGVALQRPRAGRSLRLVLVLREGQLPVTSSYFGVSARTHRDLAALRALCGTPTDLEILPPVRPGQP